MKRLTSVFALILIAFVVTANSASVRVWASNVHVRSSPSTSSSIIGSVSQSNVEAICQKQGETVSAQGYTNNWWSQINYNGGTGWVSNIFLVGGTTIAGVPTCGGSTPQPTPQYTYTPQYTPEPTPQYTPQYTSQPISRPFSGLGPCNVDSTRDGIVAAARWAVMSGGSISYTQSSRRWSGIDQRVCPYQRVPPETDCSGFVTWLFWSAFGNGNDFINGQNWRSGYTGTMGNHGTPVTLYEARPGDIVLYGTGTYNHATLYVGNLQVISFGKDGPAKLLPINYRPDFHIRSYLP